MITICFRSSRKPFYFYLISYIFVHSLRQDTSGLHFNQKELTLVDGELITLNNSLNSKYSDYEACIVKLKSTDKNFSVYSQPKCENLKERVPDTYFPWGKFGNKKLIDKCTVGIGHHPYIGLNHVLTYNYSAAESCSSRSIYQRNSLRSSWIQSTGLDYYNFDNFFILLKNHHINEIVYLGDSMSEQILNFFICDISRLGGIKIITAKTEGKEVTARIQHIATKHMINIDFFKLYYTDIGFRNLKSHLDFALSKQATVGKTLLLYNQGLHIHQNADKIIKEIAVTLIRFAKLNYRKFYVLFRETSSQHFRNPGGGYSSSSGTITLSQFNNSHHINQDNNLPYCCNTLPENEIADSESFWRNRQFKEAFNQIDPMWEQYIGWIPFFNFTLFLHDVHVEVFYEKRALKLDCTHYMYIPFSFLPLWHDTHTSLALLLTRTSPRYEDLNLSYSQPIRGNNMSNIYYVVNGKKRLFRTMQDLKKMGYNMNDCFQVTELQLNSIPEGDVI